MVLKSVCAERKYVKNTVCSSTPSESVAVKGAEKKWSKVNFFVTNNLLHLLSHESLRSKERQEISSVKGSQSVF